MSVKSVTPANTETTVLNIEALPAVAVPAPVKKNLGLLPVGVTEDFAAYAEAYHKAQSAHETGVDADAVEALDKAAYDLFEAACTRIEEHVAAQYKTVVKVVNALLS